MAESTCSVAGCERSSHARGLCGKHYQRWRDYGDENRVRPSDEERFWAKVERSGPDDCWLWMATRNHLGYGGFAWDGRMRFAHRFALQLRLGRRLEPGEIARHRCHNPPCVNPSHLLPGTKADNSRDMVEAGRATQKGARGEENGKHLLTEEQVRYIRAASEPRRVLATRYGVSPSTIKAVRARQNWRHVA